MKTEWKIGRLYLSTWDRLRLKIPKFEGETLAAYIDRIEKGVKSENDNKRNDNNNR